MGGRSTVVYALDNPDTSLELGASIFVKANRNLYSAAKELGLELKDAGVERPAEGTKALVSEVTSMSITNRCTNILKGIWDGQQFRYV